NGNRDITNGSSYSLIVRPSGLGPYSAHAFGVLELRDGEWICWPDWFTREQMTEFLHIDKNATLGAEKHNDAMTLPVRPVTRLAGFLLTSDSQGRAQGAR